MQADSWNLTGQQKRPVQANREGKNATSGYFESRALASRRTPRLPENTMKELKAKTVRAGFSQTLALAANLLLRIVSLVALARFLDPRDFGLMAMVTAVTDAFSLFSTLGLSSATVQQTTVSEKQLSTLFWVNLAVGAMLGALCVLVAPFLVRFYHEDRL